MKALGEKYLGCSIFDMSTEQYQKKHLTAQEAAAVDNITLMFTFWGVKVYHACLLMIPQKPTEILSKDKRFYVYHRRNYKKMLSINGIWFPYVGWLMDPETHRIVALMKRRTGWYSFLEQIRINMGKK